MSRYSLVMGRLYRKTALWVGLTLPGGADNRVSWNRVALHGVALHPTLNLSLKFSSVCGLLQGVAVDGCRTLGDIGL